MTNPYPRGSEWRKWDLHLHAPMTKLNDQYRSAAGDVWEKFCKILAESDVHAFGITDYFSADTYFAFIEKFNAWYPQSTKQFFPNIELRTSDVVNAAHEEVNIHIIFNPDLVDLKTKIKLLLQNLDTNKTVHGGRRIKASELSIQSHYEEATTTRDFIEKSLKATFGDKADLTEFALIFTSANNDGIRTETEIVDGKVRGKKRKAVITDELDKFSQGFFGNSRNTEYFLKKDRLENKIEAIDPKPVISGCDAHSFSDLEHWLGKYVSEPDALKEPTWIKADLTFEGVKQIIYEPEERVFIGLEPGVEIRVRQNQTKYIKSLHVDRLPEYDGRHGLWFRNETIEFNKELVAIIGNKGSGKSALTDIMGLLGDSHNQKPSGKSDELFSFLNKDKFLKGRCASNFKGELRWHGGEPDQKTLDTEIDKNIPERVEYLPQKYLEKLCANIEDDEFRGKLNEVIFGYVQEKDRFGKSDLQELIRYLTSQAGEDIKLTKHALHEHNITVVALEKKLAPDYRKEIKETIRIKEDQIAAHAGIKPVEVKKPDQSDDAATKDAQELGHIESQIEGLNQSIILIKSEQVDLSKQVENLRQARQTIERQANALSGLKTQYEGLLDSLGLSFEDIVSLSVNFAKLDEVITTKATRITEIGALLRDDNEINSLGLDPKQKEEALRNSLTCQLIHLSIQKSDIIERLGKPEREYQDYLRKQAEWDLRQKALVGDEDNPGADTLNGFKKELSKVTSSYPGDLEAARRNRESVTREIFRKQIHLLSFYNSVKQSIDKEIKKNAAALGDYEISIEAGLRFSSAFYEEFFKYINQNVKGSFHGFEEGRALLQKLCEELAETTAEEAVFSVLKTIVDHLDNDRRTGLPTTESRARDIFKQLKQQKDPVDLYDYLFGLDYLQMKYDLKVDKKDLSELSPGERGGLLLVFYLMLDRRDIPLVIDQPEDNLDNKSVYEILVTFLKKAKKRRQIILATHNPNLAVVADAEQIINVSIDKKNKNDFNFYSGSIENPAINATVVDILEGTMPAFNNRKLKYRRQVPFKP